MWKVICGSVTMDKLKYDVKEFEDLFTESADPADNKKKKTETKTKTETKKLVQVIDQKRLMNSGIVLSRLKTSNEKMAEFMNKMYVLSFGISGGSCKANFFLLFNFLQGLHQL